MPKGDTEFTGDLVMRDSLSADDWAFVRGLAMARPVSELAAELGWSSEKAARKGRSAVILAAVAAEGLSLVHRVYVPAALSVINSLLSTHIISEKIGQDGERSFIETPTPPTVRLAAAQTILKIARLEEHRPPTMPADNPLDTDNPDKLRQLLDAIEGRLSDLATPVGAQNQADDAEVIDELPNDYSVL